MFTLTWAWGDFSFMLAYFAGLMMVAWKLSKKRHFWIRFILSLFAFSGLLFLWRPFQWYVLGGASGTRSSWGLVFYLISFLLGLAIFLFCFEGNFFSALFSATVAYCLQHVSERLYEILKYLFLPTIPLWGWFLLLTSMTALIYFLFYHIVLRKTDYTAFDTLMDHRVVLVSSSIMLSTAIFLNVDLFYYFDMTNPNAKIGFCLTYAFSILTCIINLMLDFSMLKEKGAHYETERLQQLLESEKQHYEQERATMDLLNIKYHDIKHILNSISTSKDNEVIESMRKSLGEYESIVKTGNEAIDAILTSKSQYCKNKGIKFSCLLDGSALDHISNYELYALFENAIDNAINAAILCDDDKRVIAISETEQGDFVLLKVMNYFRGPLKFSDGLPQAVKGMDYHGFGMKSMKMIAEKYDGRISVVTKDDLFILQIFLPAKTNSVSPSNVL